MCASCTSPLHLNHPPPPLPTLLQVRNETLEVKVTVEDWDQLSGNDLIGWATVPLSDLTDRKPLQLWLPLTKVAKRPNTTGDADGVSNLLPPPHLPPSHHLLLQCSPTSLPPYSLPPSAWVLRSSATVFLSTRPRPLPPAPRPLTPAPRPLPPAPRPRLNLRPPRRCPPCVRRPRVCSRDGGGGAAPTVMAKTWAGRGWERWRWRCSGGSTLTMTSSFSRNTTIISSSTRGN